MFGKRIGPAAALAAGVLIAGTASAGDRDTVRLVDRPADRGTTRTLELTPADREAAKTDKTCFLFGGWGRGWGGYGWGGGYYRSWGVGLGFGGFGGYYGGFGGWGLGGYGSYWGLGFGGWPYASYSLYSPIVYAPPAVSVYTVPTVTYYSSPVIVSDSVCTPAVITRPAAVDADPVPPTRTYPYDGGPRKSIPPARDPTPDVPTVPADPAVPKLGPSPTERPISLPARPTASFPSPVKPQFRYSAYGEGPDAPKPAPRLAPRPTKELLVKGR